MADTALLPAPDPCPWPQLAPPTKAHLQVRAAVHALEDAQVVAELTDQGTLGRRGDAEGGGASGVS